MNSSSKVFHLFGFKVNITTNEHCESYECAMHKAFYGKMYREWLDCSNAFSCPLYGLHDGKTSAVQLRSRTRRRPFIVKVGHPVMPYLLLFADSSVFTCGKFKDEHGVDMTSSFYQMHLIDAFTPAEYAKACITSQLKTGLDPSSFIQQHQASDILWADAVLSDFRLSDRLSNLAVKMHQLQDVNNA